MTTREEYLQAHCSQTNIQQKVFVAGIGYVFIVSYLFSLQLAMLNFMDRAWVKCEVDW